MSVSKSAPINRQAARERELIAWEMRLRGLTEYQIAQQMKLSVQAVSSIMRRVEKRLARQTEDIALAIKIRQTQQLEYIQAEALQEWERSKAAKTKTSVTAGSLTPRGSRGGATSAGDSQPSKVFKETTERNANPDYLMVAMEAMQQVRRIWGVEQEPSRTDVHALPAVQNIQINVSNPSGGFVLGGPAHGRQLPIEQDEIVDAEAN